MANLPQAGRSCGACGAILIGLTCMVCSSLAPEPTREDVWVQDAASHDHDPITRYVLEAPVRTVSAIGSATTNAGAFQGGAFQTNAFQVGSTIRDTRLDALDRDLDDLLKDIEPG
jgi:hypothetical protein